MAFEYLVALGPSAHHHFELCIDRQNPMVKPTIFVEAFGHLHPVVFNFEKLFAHQDRFLFNTNIKNSSISSQSFPLEEFLVQSKTLS